MQAKFSRNDRIVVAQNGGSTPVINYTLVSLIRKLKELGAERIYGARFGTKGLLNGEFVDLGAQTESTLRATESTPGSALSTARYDPTEEDCGRILHTFKKMGATYFFNIGGDNTASALLKIHRFCEAAGYPLRGFHLAKTIDNDLIGHYHSPGTGSAMLWYINTLIGIQCDVDFDLPKIYIGVTMGKYNGSLAASPKLIGLATGREPNGIYVPERRFVLEKFIADAERSLSTNHVGIFVVSEGIWTKKALNPKSGKMEPEPLLKTIGAEQGDDGFGGQRLSGNGALGDFLVATVKKELRIKEVRQDTYGYAPRSAIPSVPDVEEAIKVGSEAPIHALSGEGKSGSIALKPFNEREDGMATRVIPLELVGSGTRKMPPEFLSPDGNVSEQYVGYALSLVGGQGALRKVGRLDPSLFFKVGLEDESIRV